jgi:hypothetical protein
MRKYVDIHLVVDDKVIIHHRSKWIEKETRKKERLCLMKSTILKNWCCHLRLYQWVLEIDPFQSTFFEMSEFGTLNVF